METDHIISKDDNGDDSIDNAIPVCFECHAEIHSYNDKHPRGRKYLPEELQLHKEQWLKICSERPDMLITANRKSDVGPLQALIDELEFNYKVAQKVNTEDQGCLFHEHQFLRAINDGSIAILQDAIRDAILNAYVAMGAANAIIKAAWAHPKNSNPWAYAINDAQQRIIQSQLLIDTAKRQLLVFLSTEK